MVKFNEWVFEMSVELTAGIKKHIASTWPDAKQELFSWTEGAILNSNPNFKVCRVAPCKSSRSWVYISLGASTYINKKGEHLEFAILSPRENPRHIETLFMLAHYHSNPDYRLEVGSIVRIGREWFEGSECDHLLISLPYFKGPDFEECLVDEHLIRMLWVIPVTKAEAEYCEEYGLDALESQFEINKVKVLDPFRVSTL